MGNKQAFIVKLTHSLHRSNGFLNACLYSTSSFLLVVGCNGLFAYILATNVTGVHKFRSDTSAGDCNSREKRTVHCLYTEYAHTCMMYIQYCTLPTSPAIDMNLIAFFFLYSNC